MYISFILMNPTLTPPLYLYYLYTHTHTHTHTHTPIKGGVRVGFINVNDMYNNDVGKGVYAYEAYEVK